MPSLNAVSHGQRKKKKKEREGQPSHRTPIIGKKGWGGERYRQKKLHNGCRKYNSTPHRGKRKEGKKKEGKRQSSKREKRKKREIEDLRSSDCKILEIMLCGVLNRWQVGGKKKREKVSTSVSATGKGGIQKVSDLCPEKRQDGGPDLRVVPREKGKEGREGDTVYTRGKKKRQEMARRRLKTERAGGYAGYLS